MYEKEYYAFAETWKGGKLTEDQARANWIAWKQSSQLSGWPVSDYDAVVQGGDRQLRMWVKTKDILSFKDSVERMKQLQNKQDYKGELTDTQQQGIIKGMQLDHAKVGGGAIADLQQVGSQMFASGASATAANLGCDAFGSRGMDLSNIESLCPNEESEASEEADGEPKKKKKKNDKTVSPGKPQSETGAASKKSGSSKGVADPGTEEETNKFQKVDPNAKKKAGKWFDWDKEVLIFSKAETSAIDTLEKNISTSLAYFRKELTDWEGTLTPQQKLACEKDKQMLEKRIDFLALVLEEDPYKLSQAIQKYNNEEENASNHGGNRAKGRGKGKKGKKGQKGSDADTWGKGPPCASYKSMKTISQLKERVDGYFECENKQEMTEWQTEGKDMRKPIADLVSLGSTFAKDLKKKMVDEKAKKPISNPNTQPNRIASRGTALFEVACEVGYEAWCDVHVLVPLGVQT